MSIYVGFLVSCSYDKNLSDHEQDFLVAILGLLVNLVEKDSPNRLMGNLNSFWTCSCHLHPLLLLWGTGYISYALDKAAVVKTCDLEFGYFSDEMGVLLFSRLSYKFFFVCYCMWAMSWNLQLMTVENYIEKGCSGCSLTIMNKHSWSNSHVFKKLKIPIVAIY